MVGFDPAKIAWIDFGIGIPGPANTITAIALAAVPRKPSQPTRDRRSHSVIVTVDSGKRDEIPESGIPRPVDSHQRLPYLVGSNPKSKVMTSHFGIASPVKPCAPYGILATFSAEVDSGSPAWTGKKKLRKGPRAQPGNTRLCSLSGNGPRRRGCGQTTTSPYLCHYAAGLLAARRNPRIRVRGLDPDAGETEHMCIAAGISPEGRGGWRAGLAHELARGEPPHLRKFASAATGSLKKFLPAGDAEIPDRVESIPFES
jgi:hypothetical protein